MIPHAISLLHPRLQVFLWAGLCFLFSSGCESSFEPFQQSDIHYSIFGFLDANADTQFVRVSPLRDTLYASPEPLDALVTLENLATGERTVWQDSVFRYPNGRVAHNYWSTGEILPDASYRFMVERSDGMKSTATVAVPDTFPMPELLRGGGFGNPHPTQGITITGVEKLAGVSVIYYLPRAGSTDDELVPLSISYTERVDPSPQGMILGFDAYADILAAIGRSGCPEVKRAEVIVYAATEEWPDFINLDEETIALPGTNNNIETGVGFLGGVVSRRILWTDVLGALETNRQNCLRGAYY